MTATLENEHLFATGAINSFVYTLTASSATETFTLSILDGYTVIGIFTEFAATTGVTAATMVTTDVTNNTVTLTDGATGTVIKALVIAKRS